MSKRKGTDGDSCSPGSNPHSDRPNWQPAATLDDYLHNVREGLEERSDRRLAELLGMSRIGLWRARKIAELPEGLFDAILDASAKGTLKMLLTAKSLGQLGHALSTGKRLIDVERCPHCGGVVRRRLQVSEELADFVNAWLNRNRTVLRDASVTGDRAPPEDLVESRAPSPHRQDQQAREKQRWQ